MPETLKLYISAENIKQTTTNQFGEGVIEA
jgi:hypothetical protein